MNKQVKSKCDKLIKQTKNKTIYYEDLIEELNKNSRLIKYTTTIPSSIDYISSLGYSITHRTEEPTISVAENTIIENKEVKNRNTTYIENEPSEDELYEIEDEINGYFVPSQNATTMYMNSLNSINTTVLTPEEERLYITKAQNGDMDAKTLVVERNLKLVISVIKRYIHSADSTILGFDDMIQYGNIGLMMAIERFNPDLGFKFSTYATWWIRQALFRGIETDGRIVRLPVYMLEQIRYIRKAMADLNLTFVNLVNTDYQTIADYCNENGLLVSQFKKYNKPIEAEKVREYLKYYALTDSVSLHISTDEDGDNQLIDIITDETIDISGDVENRELLNIFNYIFDNYLKPKEVEVLKMRYGFYGRSYTLQQVGDHFGVTRERIRQIENKAKDKIKKSKRINKYLEGYYFEKELDDEQGLD